MLEAERNKAHAAIDVYVSRLKNTGWSADYRLQPGEQNSVAQNEPKGAPVMFYDAPPLIDAQVAAMANPGESWELARKCLEAPRVASHRVTSTTTPAAITRWPGRSMSAKAWAASPSNGRTASWAIRITNSQAQSDPLVLRLFIKVMASYILNLLAQDFCGYSYF